MPESYSIPIFRINLKHKPLQKPLTDYIATDLYLPLAAELYPPLAAHAWRINAKNGFIQAAKSRIV
jgi:hypothetical protein